MMTSLITEVQLSLGWSVLAVWQQVSRLPRSSVHGGRRSSAAGKELGQQNARKCHWLSLDTTTLLIKK